jgi:hypothetical protein
MVINADDYYGQEAFKTMYTYLSQAKDGSQYDYCMVGYRLGNTVTENGSVSRGVCTAGADGHLISVVERTRIECRGEGIAYTEDGETWLPLAFETPVSMNMWGFTPSFLRELSERFPLFLEQALASNPLKAEFYLPAAVSQLLAEGKATVKVLHSADKWYGVTYAADKPMIVAALQAMAAQGKYPDGLWK